MSGAARVPSAIHGVGLAVLCTSLSCATVSVDPALFNTKSIAVASIHARRSISLAGLSSAGDLPSAHGDNDFGGDVLEMELSEIEGRLSEMFGADVVPAGRAMLHKTYDALPEALPLDEWTQVNDMTAVDLASADVAAALGDLARGLDVDAVIVMRHEWFIARDRLEVSMSPSAFDRCTIVVVSREGRTLWHDVVVARVPAAPQLLSGPMAGVLPGVSSADEARRLARRATRQALDDLSARYQKARETSRVARKP